MKNSMDGKKPQYHVIDFAVFDHLSIDDNGDIAIQLNKGFIDVIKMNAADPGFLHAVLLQCAEDWGKMLAALLLYTIGKHFDVPLEITQGMAKSYGLLCQSEAELIADCERVRAKLHGNEL
jgi:hypothetical protein